jgi:hypothetical protein
MPTRFIRRVVILALIPLATACSSSKYPDSPVPAALSEIEAIRLADLKLAQRDMAARHVISAEQKNDGWLLAYASPFSAGSTPPKEWTLVEVLNTGTVREIRFD